MGIFKEAGLKEWFNEEKWVDVSRPKKDGGYEECGRSDADKGKYPVCTPAAKARTLDEKERKSRIRAKRKNEKKKRKGKSPHMTQYTPSQVKNTIVGWGSATKDQIGHMVQQRLNLATVPQPADAADAAAIALCHCSIAPFIASRDAAIARSAR